MLFRVINIRISLSSLQIFNIHQPSTYIAENNIPFTHTSTKQRITIRYSVKQSFCQFYTIATFDYNDYNAFV